MPPTFKSPWGAPKHFTGPEIKLWDDYTKDPRCNDRGPQRDPTRTVDTSDSWYLITGQSYSVLGSGIQPSSDLYLNSYWINNGSLFFFFLFGRYWTPCKNQRFLYEQKIENLHLKKKRAITNICRVRSQYKTSNNKTFFSSYSLNKVKTHEQYLVVWQILSAWSPILTSTGTICP